MPSENGNYTARYTWYTGLYFYADGSVERLIRRNDVLQVCELTHPDGRVTKAATDIDGNFIPIDRAED